MAFENLSERIQKALKNLTGKGKVSEEDINKASREIRLALLEADVNFKVVKDFIKTIKKEALSLIHISEPTRRTERSRMPSSA